MAVVRYGEGMTNFGSPIDQVDLPSLAVTVATGTLARLVDVNGAAISITGSGLTYAAGGISGGTLTGIEVFAEDGGSLFSVTGLSKPAAPIFASFVATGDLDIAVLDGDDKIFGSSNGDLMAGGAGNDRLFGGGGRDLLGAMDGRDRMTGGTAADVFVFSPNKGRDTVMDFADDGTRTDDFIAVQPRLYSKMVMTQEGADVLLDFGKAGSLLILNQTVAEMGVDDFLTGALPF